MSALGCASADPPSRWNTWPDACTVITRIAMLNSVRYGGFGVRELSVVWLQPLAAPTIIVACGPRRISDAMSTTYDTDMLEPLAMGNWILNAEVSDESRTSTSSGRTGTKVARGSSPQNSSVPSTITKRMYERARAGRSRSKASQVYLCRSCPFVA